MYTEWKNKIVALTLIAVFSLNTLAGFACSIGIDLGYNAKHHSTEASCCRNKHKHCSTQTMNKGIFQDTNHDCCSSDVAQFTLLDKSVVTAYAMPPAPVFSVAWLPPAQAVIVDEPLCARGSPLRFARRSCFVNDTDIITATRSLRI
jgi:hypothetical protein